MNHEHCYLLIINIVMAVAMVFTARIMYITNRREELRPKRDVLRRLVGYRHRLTESLKGQDAEPFVALNEAIVVFADNHDVMAALRKICKNEDHLSENICTLTKAMASEVGYPADSISNEMLERPFTPPTT